jgi:hypothetical protein
VSATGAPAIVQMLKQCSGRGSNPHVLYGQGILSLTVKCRHPVTTTLSLYKPGTDRDRDGHEWTRFGNQIGDLIGAKVIDRTLVIQSQDHPLTTNDKLSDYRGKSGVGVLLLHQCRTMPDKTALETALPRRCFRHCLLATTVPL